MLAMRPRDLLAFAQMHLDDGKAADGTQVLAPGTAATMHARQVDLPDLGLMGTSWGLGFERFDTPDGAIIGHDGGTIGQAAFLRIVPEAGVAVALLTNGGDVISLYHDVVGHVIEELTDTHLPALPGTAGRPAADRRRAGSSARTPPRSSTSPSARTTTAGSGSSRSPRGSSRSSARSPSARSSSTTRATA